MRYRARKPKAETTRDKILKKEYQRVTKAMEVDALSYYDQYADLKWFWPRFRKGDAVAFTGSTSDPDILGYVVEVSSWRSYLKSDKEGEYPIDVWYTYTVEVDSAYLGSKSYTGPMQVKVQDHQIRLPNKNDKII